MCVFLISPVPIAEPLTSELIDTPVFYNLAPRPIKYRVSVPIPSCNGMIFWRYDNRLIKFHGIMVFGVKQSKQGFFWLTKHVFIQISFIKNYQADLIIDYILV